MGPSSQRNSSRLPSRPPFDPQRKRIAILSAVVACMAAPGAFLLRHFHTAQWIWLLIMIGLLVYIGIALARLKHSNRRGW